LFNRPEPRSTFPDLVRSLLADVPRKNSRQPADHIGHVNAYRFEHLHNSAKWDADALRDQVLRVPIIHPSRSSCMRVLSEDAAEPITSADIKAGDLGWDGARLRQRPEGSCLSESPVWPMFVVERLELSQRVE
jgi:hypothetical protein